jgi:hypothetical protein
LEVPFGEMNHKQSYFIESVIAQVAINILFSVSNTTLQSELVSVPETLLLYLSLVV